MVLYVQGDSIQQTGALLHTKLPTIRTKSKQRPGKRRSATGVAAAAVAAPTIAELPWMQEWIATGALSGTTPYIARVPYFRECSPDPHSAVASAAWLLHQDTLLHEAIQVQGTAKGCQAYGMIKYTAAPTGRTAEDREAEQEHTAAVASTSGRSASAMESIRQGIPGVFIVHTDGMVATDAAYSR